MHDSVEACVQCHKEFLLTSQERTMYFRLGYSLPKRCPTCRKQRREHPDPYDGWKSTMKLESRKSRKHSRVPYAPFVIGGLTN